MDVQEQYINGNLITCLKLKLLQSLSQSRVTRLPLHSYIHFATSLYALFSQHIPCLLDMAKCSGCNKTFADNYLTYHRSKCNKSKNLLQRSLHIFHRRKKAPVLRPEGNLPAVAAVNHHVKQVAPRGLSEDGFNNKVSGGLSIE